MNLIVKCYRFYCRNVANYCLI